MIEGRLKQVIGGTGWIERASASLGAICVISNRQKIRKRGLGGDMNTDRLAAEAKILACAATRHIRRGAN